MVSLSPSSEGVLQVGEPSAEVIMLETFEERPVESVTKTGGGILISVTLHAHLPRALTIEVLARRDRIAKLDRVVHDACEVTIQPRGPAISQRSGLPLSLDLSIAIAHPESSETV